MAFDDKSLERIRNAVRKVERSGNRRVSHWPKINQQSQNEWHGILVDEGPNGEADFSDNRYWVRAAFVANDITGIDLDDTSEVQTHEREAISLSIEKDGSDYLEAWFMATHYGESSAETHDLPVDGTQYVLIKRTFDRSGCIRFFFWVTPNDRTLPIGGEFLAGGSRVCTSLAVKGANNWSVAFRTLTDTGGTLYDVAVYDDTLIACGAAFNITGTGNCELIYWTGTAWAELSGHDLGPIYCLCVFNGLLYLGGSRVSVGDNVQTYNGSTFSNATGTRGIALTVRCLHDWEGTLVAGGESSSGDGYHGIQQLSGSAWASMGAGFLKGVNPGSIFSLCTHGTDLAAGGNFDDADGTPTENVALWDGSWSSVGGGIAGGSTFVYALASYNDDLFAGGNFSHIKKVIAGAWSDHGDTLSTYLTNGSITVYSLCVSPDGTELYIGGNSQTRDDAFYDQLPCLCVAKYLEMVDAANWVASTAYAKGDIVFPLAGGQLAFQCIVAGTSGSSEPAWDTTIGDTTTDNTVSWVTIYRDNFQDLFGGLGSNGANSIPGEAGPTCYAIRNYVLPGDTDESTIFVGDFTLANSTYSPLVIGIRPGGYRAIGKGLRYDAGGNYIGTVLVAVSYQGGTVIAGLFDTALNEWNRGEGEILEANNVCLFSGGGLSTFGHRYGQQNGGCLYGGTVVLCGEDTDAHVAKKATASTWQASTAYAQNEVVIPTVATGFQYVCIVAGTSSGTEPTWPVVLNGTVLDGGTLEWQAKYTGWVPIGANLGTGEYLTVADFNSTLWLGGTGMQVSSSSSVYATSNGAINAGGNWTGGNITDIQSIQKFCIGDYGSGDRLIAACVNISTTGCVHVSSGGSFSELGGVGNRVGGEARDVAVWSRENGTKIVVVCGNLNVNGTDCAIAIYEGGTWSVLHPALDLLGQATCLGEWVRERYGFLCGGDFNVIDNLPMANLVAYRDGDGFDYLRGTADVGGTTAATRRLGAETTAG